MQWACSTGDAGQAEDKREEKSLVLAAEDGQEHNWDWHEKRRYIKRRGELPDNAEILVEDVDLDMFPWWLMIPFYISPQHSSDNI